MALPTTPWLMTVPPPRPRGALGWALLVSVLVHLAVLATLTVLRETARRSPGLLPEVIEQALLRRPPEPPAPGVPATPEPEIELPLEFIEVDPALATEPPPDARFYSTASTRAANPNPPKSGEKQPFVDGWDEAERRTFRVERPTLETPVAAAARAELEAVQDPRTAPLATPLAEPPRPERQAREAVPEQPEGGPPAGETQMAKAVVKPAVPTPQPARPAQEAVVPQTAVPSRPEARPEPAPPRRNRSVREAREARGLLVGEKMKQDGGVERFQLESSLDVRASPFADYDRQFIYAVQQRWYQLLDEHHYSLDRSGKVILRFRLQSDGTITDMAQVQSDVGEVWAFVCESAVLTPSPYARWPSEMRRLIGADFREVTFTFRYY